MRQEQELLLSNSKQHYQGQLIAIETIENTGYAKVSPDNTNVSLGYTKTLTRGTEGFEKDGALGITQINPDTFYSYEQIPSTEAGNYWPVFKTDVAQIKGDENSSFTILLSSGFNVGQDVNFSLSHKENYNDSGYKEVTVPLPMGMNGGIGNILLEVDADNLGLTTEYNFKNCEIQYQKYVVVNYASKEELTELIGIGEVLAQRIIDYRENEEEFESLDDLQNIKGIGTATVQKIRDQDLARVNDFFN